MRDRPAAAAMVVVVTVAATGVDQVAVADRVAAAEATD
jgi:hypothetical protein